MTRPVGGRVSPSGYVVINPDGLRRFVAAGGGPVMADLMRRATNVQGGAVRQVGKRTRRLERSIVKRPDVDAQGPFIVVTTEGVSYSLMHHDGTDTWHGNQFLADNLRLAAR